MVATTLSRFSRMKFSYRMTAVLILFTTVMVLLLTWGNDMIMWDDTSQLASKHTSMPLTSGHLKPQKEKVNFIPKFKPASPVVLMHSTSAPKVLPVGRVEPYVGDVNDVCEFGDRPALPVTVDTYDVLDKVDRGNVSFPEIHADFRSEAEIFKSYKSPNGLPLKIIAVPHSHSDPGWQKTVDSYFEDQTKNTLNNMVEKLKKFPQMTFIWAESVFLSLWWQELSPETQEDVRMLIKRGQLEIVVGSWVVPDEANPHFFALIDQMIEGHSWLHSTLGVKPRNVWTLDPFGYSSTLPYLYKQAGYDNMVILRVHEWVKAELQNRKSLEFMWRQRWSNNYDDEIFTLMMPYKLYNIKHSCGPDTNICLEFDFRRIPGEVSESRASLITDENVDAKARLLLSQYIAKNKLYNHNVVLIPIGDDFRYDRNIEWDQQYMNYQKLFDYINSKSEWNVQARFGTIQDYFDEVRASFPVTNRSFERAFPSLSGDFFPYTDENMDYWTGYFTTRPYDKVLSRELEVNLRSAEILYSLARAVSLKKGDMAMEDLFGKLTDARQGLGLFQHHDGITGTEKSWVVTDYEDRLIHGLRQSTEVIENSVAYLLVKDKTQVKKAMEVMNVTPIKSYRLLTDPSSDQVITLTPQGIKLIVFNPLARKKQELIQLVVSEDSVRVTDDRGKAVTSQMNPMWTTNQTISSARYELMFFADLEPLTLNSFVIKPVKQGRGSQLAQVYLMNHTPRSKKHHSNFKVQSKPPKVLTLENKMLKATLSAKTGFLHTLTTKPDGTTTKVDVDFRLYKSSKSGAYLFGPAGPAVDTDMNARPAIRAIYGPVVSEIHSLQSLVNHTIRLYNTSSHLGKGLEIVNIVDMRLMDEKELIMHLDTDINHNGTFFTDQNGLQCMQRQRFKRLPSAANYYPFTAYAFLEDIKGRLTLAAAQPLGVSSQENGGLEVMLDRRLLYDDGRGLGEGVQDNRRTPSRFFLVAERPSAHLSEKRDPLLRKPLPGLQCTPSLLINLIVEDLRHYSPQIITDPIINIEPRYKGLSLGLPCDIQLVNLRSMSEGDYALLLHHVASTCDYPDGGLDCSLSSGSSAVKFSGLTVSSAVKTSLSLMHDKNKLPVSAGLTISLKPMEIQAYRLQFN